MDYAAADPVAEFRAALEDPYPDEDELAHLLSEARRRGEDIDAGLLADVGFHTQRLAKFWGAEREYQCVLVPCGLVC